MDHHDENKVMMHRDGKNIKARILPNIRGDRTSLRGLGLEIRIGIKGLDTHTQLLHRMGLDGNLVLTSRLLQWLTSMPGAVSRAFTTLM